jgi:hypothetical protein
MDMDGSPPIAPRDLPTSKRSHNLEHLEEANRHVAQSEQLVAGWRDVVDRMQAEGRDVTVAQDLLETFQGIWRSSAGTAI